MVSGAAPPQRREGNDASSLSTKPFPARRRAKEAALKRRVGSETKREEIGKRDEIKRVRRLTRDCIVLKKSEAAENLSLQPDATAKKPYDRDNTHDRVAKGHPGVDRVE